MSLADKDTKTDNKVARPKQYVVVFLNDDFTPQDFVVFLLVEVFKQSTEQAIDLMLTVHKSGKGQLGPYTHEIAETLVQIASQYARKYEFPFRCDIAEA